MAGLGVASLFFYYVWSCLFTYSQSIKKVSFKWLFTYIFSKTNSVGCLVGKVRLDNLKQSLNVSYTICHHKGYSISKYKFWKIKCELIDIMRTLMLDPIFKIFLYSRSIVTSFNISD